MISVVFNKEWTKTNRGGNRDKLKITGLAGQPMHAIEGSFVSGTTKLRR